MNEESGNPSNVRNNINDDAVNSSNENFRETQMGELENTSNYTSQLSQVSFVQFVWGKISLLCF